MRGWGRSNLKVLVGLCMEELVALAYMQKISRLAVTCRNGQTTNRMGRVKGMLIFY
jgi:hypothetical protein